MTVKNHYEQTRNLFSAWENALKENYFNDLDYQHTLRFHHSNLFEELSSFGAKVSTELEPLVKLNNLSVNLPRVESYNAIGQRLDEVVHHPSYVAAGNIIYGSGLLEKMAKAGGLFDCLSLLFLSAQTGEAGHNCPIACSAGIIRVLQRVNNVPEKDFFLRKLIMPSYQENFTGAQFLTEIQGGSDVGLNATYAEATGDHWRIYGEKWFCSNANAELIFITARYDQASTGTKGLGLFLIPAKWKNQKNHYQIRRLKDKIGTRSMATGEIDFNGAYAYQVGELEKGFHLAMAHVLHLSRIFNSVCVVGMAKRAYLIARSYAHYRIVFDHSIEQYPLVQENLARVKAENMALIAAVFATIKLQDQYDLSKEPAKEASLLLRLLVNLLKYLTALWSFDHIHHCLDTLAGNGTIETFSALPRFLRDSIVCENWEGAHNVLRMQVYKDMLKYNVDKIFLAFIQDKITSLAAPERDFFQQKLSLLKLEFEKFRKQAQEIQLLQIKLVVDRMVILYCGIALLAEASDQEGQSKRDCYDLFKKLHLDDKPINLDGEYLKLIKKIVNLPSMERSEAMTE